MTQGSDTPLELGREAARDRDWARAYAQLVAADSAGRLTPEDMESLAEAAWVTGRYEDALRAMERAHTGHVERGNAEAAALLAVELANEYFPRGELAVGAGWHATAKRMLAELPESRAHGLHRWTEAQLALIQRQLPAALEHATAMRNIGNRLGALDVEMLGLATAGRALARLGRVPEALAAVDEAMAVAVSGRLRPWPACQIYCQTLNVCGDLADFRRAGEWTVEAQRCCVRETIVPASGDCRVHRACVLRWRGAWGEAEEDALIACDQLRGNAIHVGMAQYELGEMRLRQGRLAAAEEAFARAHELGRPPQPGLALLRLAQGRPDAAQRAIAQALAEESDDLQRAQLLSAQVEIALVAGDRDGARDAARRLAAIAARFGTHALQASSVCADGAIRLAEGTGGGACEALRRGIRLWQEIGVPYEAARARLLLAQAHLAREERESGALELRAAQRAFERLGAAREARSAADALAAIDDDRFGAAAAPRALMFTDIVGSTPLLEAIGDEAWLHVLRWHDETLRALFVKHEGEEVNKMGDGFFVAFEHVGEALDCAIDVQRTLAEHRHAHGFAPQVRIGVHADVTPWSGSSYEGRGVHVAARVAALAHEGEILVTRAALSPATAAAEVGEPRTVRLKGVAEPIEVAAVNWN